MNKLRSKAVAALYLRMQMYLFALVGTHPLLPQLLFQRRQATFLPQHAAVPPAERRIHINQLRVAVLAAGGPGVNRQAEIKRDGVSFGENNTKTT